MTVMLTVLPLTFGAKMGDMSGTVYIRANGSVEPLNAPISNLDNMTYTLTGNITSSGDGIIVERDNIIIDGNQCIVHGFKPYSGIVLAGRSNVTVKNTAISNFENGINLTDTNGTNISGDNLTANGANDIYLYSSFNDDINDNIMTNSDFGICLLSSSNVSIERNNITANNDNAIRLDYSSTVNISGNEITANTWGINLGYSSSDVSVIGNKIANNNIGIWLYSSSNNRIYHNKLVNNVQQVYSVDSTNVWDDGASGNYWSNYNGTDANHDAIGDTPYVIDANNKDNYPLMPPQLPGDVNGDSKVNLQDLVLLALAYGSKPGDLNWNPYADIDGNGDVDQADLAILTENYGKLHNPSLFFFCLKNV